jgi:hypothetical protein
MESTVREKSDGMYRIKYDSLEMDELAGNLSITNMNLSYDSARYLDYVRMGKEPSILMSIFIPMISVTGVNTKRVLVNNEIIGRKLEIKGPVINIIYTNSVNDSTRVVPVNEIYGLILGNLDLMQVDSVLISGAQIITSSHKTKKISIQIRDVSITLLDVKVDSSSNVDTTRMIFAKAISLSCRYLSWLSGNNLYNYRADSISLSSITRHLQVKSFQITPILNEETFVKSHPEEDKRLVMMFRNIRLQNIDFQELVKQNIRADSMLIGGADYKIFCDMGISHPKRNRIGDYPQQILQKIPVSLRVKKIVLSNGYLEYRERNKTTRRIGKVQLYHMNAVISNFTNDKVAIAIDNIMKVDIRSSFLNKTPFNLTCSFYFLHPQGRFDLRGYVGPIDGTSLNPIVEPMGDVSIKKGTISGVEFDLHGNNYNMDGTVKMEYKDLKVFMLKTDRGKNELGKRSVMSLLANMFIVNSNPRKNEAPRVVQVHTDRDPNYTIVNLSWNTLLKGIGESVEKGK